MVFLMRKLEVHWKEWRRVVYGLIVTLAGLCCVQLVTSPDDASIGKGAAASGAYIRSAIRTRDRHVHLWDVTLVQSDFQIQVMIQ